MAALLPAERLDLTLTYARGQGEEEGRHARLEGGGDWPQRLADLKL